MHSRIIIYLIFASALLAGCTEEGNSDSASEISCASVSGSWMISSVRCDGLTNSSYSPSTFIFPSNAEATINQGSESCSSSSNWTVAHGTFDASLHFTGSGTMTCTQSGTTASSCTGDGFSCDGATDVSSHVNSYTTCAVGSAGMVWQRTVSTTNDPNGLSPCSEGQVEEVTLIEVTTNDGLLVIAELSPSRFVNVPPASSETLTLNLANHGAASVTALSASGLTNPFGFLGGSFPGSGGTCTNTLNPGENCSIVISFHPITPGSYADDIEFSYNNGTSIRSLTHSLTGTSSGSPNALVIVQGAPAVFDFGIIPRGISEKVILTLENIGLTTATGLMDGGTLSGAYGFTGASFPGNNGTCSATLASYATCTIEISFSPSSVGTFTDPISINYHDGVTQQVSTRPLEATAVEPALLTITESPTYDFAAVVAPGSVSTHIFTVTNTGGYSASAFYEIGMTAPFSFTGTSFPGNSGTCLATLSAGASCDIELQFAPASSGPFSGPFRLRYNNGVANQNLELNLQGTGL